MKRALPPHRIDWDAVRERLAAADADDRRRSPEAVRALLAERARAAARPPEAGDPRREDIELVAFDLGGERYAIDATLVREVARLGTLASVPGAPDHVAGVASLRGEIVAVMDLRRLLGADTPDATDRSRLVVIGRDGTEYGFLADAVHGQLRERRDRIAPPGASLPEATRALARGIAPGARIVLDGAALLDDPRLTIDQAD